MSDHGTMPRESRGLCASIRCAYGKRFAKDGAWRWMIGDGSRAVPKGRGGGGIVREKGVKKMTKEGPWGTRDDKDFGRSVVVDEERRQMIIAGVIAAAGVATRRSHHDPLERVRKAAEELVAAMEAVHGTPFVAHIDHSARIAAVSRARSSPRANRA